MQVEVLRLGHRYVRDQRVTTHILLAARAFGANKVIYAGQRDEKLEEKIRKVVNTWGGSFKVEYTENWKNTILNWKEKKGEVIHLTFYGLIIRNIIDTLKKSKKDKLIVVGGAKVPALVYKISDWNVSVTSQPHSEISALSVFLHELFEGEEIFKVFNDAKLKIEPQSNGKKVLKI